MAVYCGACGEIDEEEFQFYLGVFYSTASQTLVGGSLGLGYNELSVRVIQGRAPTAGERTSSFLVGSTLGSGLIGTRISNTVVNGVSNGALSGFSGGVLSQTIDQGLGSRSNYDWNLIIVNTGIQGFAGGIGGTVPTYYSVRPLATGTSNFSTGFVNGLNAQIDRLPRFVVAREVRAHLEGVNSVINPPAPRQQSPNVAPAVRPSLTPAVSPPVAPSNPLSDRR